MPRVPALIVALCLCALATACGGGEDPAREQAEPVRATAEGATTPRPPAAKGVPNILVVMTDDQAEEGWQEWMPRTGERVAGEGATFENSFTTTPLCCPSRATFLTGQYAHNHGIAENSPGYPALRDPGSLLPVWLQRAGYRTAHVGKWLHGYEDVPGTEAGLRPPPGWDEWDGLLAARYYDYYLSVNGTRARFDHEPSDHADAVVTRYALRFLRTATDRRDPFFLSLAYLAPHSDNARPPAGRACGEAGEAVPPPRDLELASALEGFPDSRAFNEEDVSDKPSYVRDLPKLSEGQLDLVELAVGCQRASLRSVDIGVSAVLDALERAGELDETLVVFTSDNGYLNGEHRFNHGKSVPFDEAVSVPLAIRPPAGTEPIEVEAAVANLDLAPTLLDYARARPCAGPGDCRELDGRSLRPLIEGEEPGWAAGRTILIESEKRTQGTCSWRAARTPSASYAEHVVSRKGGGCGGRETELYDLEADPEELENASRDPRYAAERRRLASELRRLADCAGAECR